MTLVCAGCGEREKDPVQPWYRLTMMLSSREIRTWNYCRRACIAGDPRGVAEGDGQAGILSAREGENEEGDSE